MNSPSQHQQLSPATSLPRITGLLLTLLSFTLILHAQDRIPGKLTSGSSPSIGSGTTWQVFSINNLWSWQCSEGFGNRSPTNKSGGYFPQFATNIVYQDNLVLGGVMYTGGFPENGGTKAWFQPIRVNGGTWWSSHGMVRGWVYGTGIGAWPADTNSAAVRMYRIRRDYAEMSDNELRRDAAIVFELAAISDATQTMMDQVRNAYRRDWVEWPVQQGAPYIERNGVQGYQPPPQFGDMFTVDSLIDGDHDEPGVSGGYTDDPADQVLWTVYNGLDREKSLLFEGSEPIGLEIQKTVWGYRRTDALGSAYFTRYRIINKGGVIVNGYTPGSFFIDSMFVAQWADLDIGNAVDDFLGCDSILGLGYTYNAQNNDKQYRAFNLPPPSAGYDILAGGLISAPTDSGIFDLKRIFGKKNLEMTSFAYHISGGPFSDPPFGDYDRGTGRWWHMLRGYAPIGSIYDPPILYPAPPPFPETKFPISGDPVTNTGFTERSFVETAPGDRRILVASGPFRMAPQDTQDVHVAFVAGLGGDYLSSINVMKANDRICQAFFDKLMATPHPPRKPNLKVTELDGEILLDWSFDQAAIAKTEDDTIQPGGYIFEGYNIYQFPRPTAGIDEAIKIATYDVVNGITIIYEYNYDIIMDLFVGPPVILQRGMDSGLARFVRINRDYLRDIPRLYNGEEYCFGVTAYSRTTMAGYIGALESNPVMVRVRPRRPFGTQIVSASGDSIPVSHVSGTSNGAVVVTVADPLAITGDEYEIKFDSAGTWGVYDITKGQWAALNLTNLSGDTNYPVVDGFMPVVKSSPNGFTSFETIANGTGPLDPPEAGALSINSNGFPPLVNSLYPAGSESPHGARQQSASTGLPDACGWALHTGMSGTSNQGLYSYFLNRIASSYTSTWPLIVPYDFEIRFTYLPDNWGLVPEAYSGTTNVMLNVPFELWNIGSNTPNDPSDDFRIFPAILDRNANGAFDLAPIDHAVSGGTNDPETDWIYWAVPSDKTPGESGYQAIVSKIEADVAGFEYPDFVTIEGEGMRRIVLVGWNMGDVTDPQWPSNLLQSMPEQGTVFRITTTKPITSSDRFVFSTAAFAPRMGLSETQASVQNIGVFPNPYYGGKTTLSTDSRPYVTFTNLPEKARICIYNLAGQLVRTLNKDDASQYLRWDLTNEHNWAVAGGIYVCHIDLPEIGATKIVKLGVIQTK